MKLFFFCSNDIMTNLAVFETLKEYGGIWRIQFWEVLQVASSEVYHIAVRNGFIDAKNPVSVLSVVSKKEFDAKSRGRSENMCKINKTIFTISMVVHRIKNLNLYNVLSDIINGGTQDNDEQNKVKHSSRFSLH